MDERRKCRRMSLAERVSVAADMANEIKEPWLIWCDLNDESKELAKAIPDSVEVCGSDSMQEKEDRMAGFKDGKYRVIVTKPSICGWGMNWQHCRRMAFVGLSDSYEQFYQAVRRCWRFGQNREVFAYVIASNTEGAVVSNIRRKEADAERMAQEMVKNMHDLNRDNLTGTKRDETKYKPTTEIEMPKFI